MRKNVFGRKFKRDKNERKALFKSLMSSFIMAERIETSEAKAKAIKPEIEKLITKAKQGTNSAKLILQKSLTKEAFDKIIKEIAPRFTKRQGGYVRLMKSGNRFGDDAPTVIMEWTEMESQISNIKSQIPVEKKTTVRVQKPTRKSPARKLSTASAKGRSSSGRKKAAPKTKKAK